MTAAGSQKNRGRGCPSNKESWENDVRTNLLFCIGIVAGCQRFICFDDAGEGRLAKYSPAAAVPCGFILVRPSAGAAARWGSSISGTALHRQNGSCWAGCGWREWQRFLPFICWPYYRLSRRLSRGERHLSLSHAEQQEIRRVFYEIKSTLKIAAPVQLCISSQAAGPMLLGFCDQRWSFPIVCCQRKTCG